MNSISLNVTGNKLTLTGGAEPLSGSFGYDRCAFTFDSEWNGFTKSAVFSMGNSEECTVILESNQCVIPDEMLRKSGLLKIGVTGINPSGTLISSNQIALRVRCGTNETETFPTAVAAEMRESGGGVG